MLFIQSLADPRPFYSSALPIATCRIVLLCSQNIIPARSARTCHALLQRQLKGSRHDPDILGNSEHNHARMLSREQEVWH